MDKLTRRVSIRGFPEAYVGRRSSVPPSLRLKLGGDGAYGNRHPVGFLCRTCAVVHQRGEALAAFRRDFAEDIQRLDYRDKIEKLRGLDIACHCSLADDGHGDVYVEWLNSHARP